MAPESGAARQGSKEGLSHLQVHIVARPRLDARLQALCSDRTRVLPEPQEGAAAAAARAFSFSSTHPPSYFGTGERFGAGGSSNGAVLATTEGAGLGRRLPGPSPALATNSTNSTAAAPTAEAKGPGGRGARGEPRGAWCWSLRRRGEAIRGRERELEKQHSPKLTTTRIAFIVSLRLHRRKTTRNRRDGYDGP